MGKTSGNKNIKEQLIKEYGNGCMFERAHIAERIAARGGIRTFKSFQTEKRFKGQKLSYQLTLHHLQHRSEGGKTSIDNGAVVSEAAHQYIHSLPRDEEEYINNMLREFKINCVAMQGNGTIIDKISITTTPQSQQEYISIPVYNNIPEQEQLRKEQNQKEKRRNNYNLSRAKRKQELKELIADYEYDR